MNLPHKRAASFPTESSDGEYTNVTNLDCDPKFDPVLKLKVNDADLQKTCDQGWKFTLKKEDHDPHVYVLNKVFSVNHLGEKSDEVLDTVFSTNYLDGKCCPDVPEEYFTAAKRVLQSMIDAKLLTTKVSPDAMFVAHHFTTKCNGDLRLQIADHAVTESYYTEQQMIYQDIPVIAENFKWTATLDIKNAFYQVLLNPESKIAIKTLLGPLQYNVIPMGLKAGYVALERIITDVLGSPYLPERNQEENEKGIIYTFASDNVYIFARTEKKCLKYCEDAMNLLRWAGIVLNTAKCTQPAQKIKISHIEIDLSTSFHDGLGGFFKEAEQKMIVARNYIIAIEKMKKEENVSRKRKRDEEEEEIESEKIRQAKKPSPGPRTCGKKLTNETVAADFTCC